MARLRREVRALRAYAVVSGVVLGVLSLAAFQARRAPHFDEIDVGRINVVEKDGTPRLILSNKAQYPGLIIRGKEYPHPRGQAGILFFNDEGTENGGVGTSVAHDANGYHADGGLMFDQYMQDQTVGLVYTDDNGRRAAGLRVWDRPDIPIDSVIRRVQAIRAMPDGPEKTRAMEALRDAAGKTRVVVGKMRDSSAAVVLADAQGRPRLRLVVAPGGASRIEFLDEHGKVTRALSGTGDSSSH